MVWMSARGGLVFILKEDDSRKLLGGNFLLLICGCLDGCYFCNSITLIARLHVVEFSFYFFTPMMVPSVGATNFYPRSHLMVRMRCVAWVATHHGIRLLVCSLSWRRSLGFVGESVFLVLRPFVSHAVTILASVLEDP